MESKMWVIKYRKTIIICTFLLAILSILPLLRVRINSDLMTYLPADMPAVANTKKIEAVFGKADPVILVIETDDVLNDSTLRRIQALSKAFNRLNDFDMVMSLFDTKNIRGEFGAMIVDPAVKRIPKNENERELLRNELINNELAYELIVSEDFRHSIIILNSVSSKDDAELIQMIEQTISQFPGNEKVMINGQPYLRAEAREKIARDFILLLPLGLLVMCLFLWFSFREKRGVVLPTFAVVLSILVSMSLIPLLHWDLSIIAILIPIMMIAIANDYGIHFMSKYQELNAKHPDWSITKIVEKTTRYLVTPVIFTGLTTIVGIAGLITHVMLPAKQMGIVASVGIGFALLASLTFIPAIMLYLQRRKPHQSFTQDGKKYYTDKILNSIGKLVVFKPRLVLYLFAGISTLAAMGISMVHIASDFDAILPQHHPYNISLKLMNKQFGGTKSINVLFEGDIKDPVFLKNMIAYQQALEKVEGVGSVNSIASIIKIMSRALHEPGDSFYNQIPHTRNAVAQYLELYSMSGNPEDFEDFVDFDYTKANMQIQFHANSLSQSNEIIQQVTSIVTKDNNFRLIGGMGVVENKLSNALAYGQINSLVFAIVAIFILLMIIFRSFYAGLIGSLPLLFAVICIFGVMGWAGIELNIVTALLTSISIGLGVDYTIHIFWRIKSEIAEGAETENAVQNALKTTGRGIIINAFSVIVGFAILFFSGFPLIHMFAFLIILSIVLCLISGLIFIPAIILIFEPQFLCQTKNTLKI